MNKYSGCWILTVVMLLWCVPGEASTRSKFRACVESTGDKYAAARDRLLDSSRINVDYLRGRLNSRSWPERVTATILLGWIENEKEYRMLLWSPKVVDHSGASHYGWHGTPGQFNSGSFPLFYEMIFKSSDGAIGQADAYEVLAAHARHHDSKVDVTLLHQGLDRRNGLDVEKRRIIASLVREASPTSPGFREVELAFHAELEREDRDDNVVLNLVRALARSAQNQSLTERKRLAEKLIEDEDLQAIVGQRTFVHAIGRFGPGEIAAPIVQSYLDELKRQEKEGTDWTAYRSEMRWALATLSTMEADSAEGQ